MKNVLDVGQCQPDHWAIRQLIEGNFDAKVVQVHDARSALSRLKAGAFDLVLINRKLDADYSDGLTIIEQIKADPDISAVPVMLVTNYAEHQQTAIAAGAEPGFGKAQTGDPETVELLRRFLG